MMPDMNDDALNEKLLSVSKQTEGIAKEVKSFKEQVDKVEAIESALEEVQESVKANADNAEALGKANERADELQKNVDGLQKNVDELLTASKDASDDTDFSLEKAFVDQGNGVFEAKFEIVRNDNIDKAITAGVGVPGSTVSALTPVVALQQSNFVRQYINASPVNGGSFTNPTLSGIVYANQADTSSKPADASALTSETVNLLNWTAENQISNAAIDDVPGLDASIVMAHSYALGAAEAADAVAVLKAASTAEETKSGSGTGLAADAAGILLKMSAALDAAYRNGAEYFLSQAAFNGLLTKVGGDTSGGGAPVVYVYNQTTRKYEVGGIPVNIIHAMEDAAANALVGALVNVPLAMVLGSTKELSITRNPQTRPNALTYAGNARNKHAIRDPKAIVRYVVKA